MILLRMSEGVDRSPEGLGESRRGAARVVDGLLGPGLAAVLGCGPDCARSLIR